MLVSAILHALQATLELAQSAGKTALPANTNVEPYVLTQLMVALSQSNSLLTQ